MATELTQKKVLIVDDEQDLREAIATSLSYQGIAVLTAKDGEEGFALALAEKPDLILLDIMMPKMDGMTMLAQLREDAWGKSAHVIVMSVLDDLHKIAETVEKGGLEYILKSDISLAGIVDKVKMRLGL